MVEDWSYTNGWTLWLSVLLKRKGVHLSLLLWMHVQGNSLIYCFITAVSNRVEYFTIKALLYVSHQNVKGFIFNVLSLSWIFSNKAFVTYRNNLCKTTATEIWYSDNFFCLKRCSDQSKTNTEYILHVQYEWTVLELEEMKERWAVLTGIGGIGSWAI